MSSDSESPMGSPSASPTNFSAFKSKALSKMQDIAQRLVHQSHDLSKEVAKSPTKPTLLANTKDSPTTKKSRKRNLGAAETATMSAEVQAKVDELQKELKRESESKQELERELQRRLERYIKRENEYKQTIDDLSAQLRSRGDLDVSTTKMGNIRGMHQKILDNVVNIQGKTAKILQDQEKDLVRQFRAKLAEIQKQLEEERNKRNDGASEWIEQMRKLSQELDWTKEMADKMDRQNQHLIKDNQRLKTQFKSQEEDREFLVKQIVVLKKENAKLRDAVKQLTSTLELYNESAAAEAQAAAEAAMMEDNGGISGGSSVFEELGRVDGSRPKSRMSNSGSQSRFDMNTSTHNLTLSYSTSGTSLPSHPLSKSSSASSFVNQQNSSARRSKSAGSGTRDEESAGTPQPQEEITGLSFGGGGGGSKGSLSGVAGGGGGVGGGMGMGKKGGANRLPLGTNKYPFTPVATSPLEQGSFMSRSHSSLSQNNNHALPPHLTSRSLKDKQSVRSVAPPANINFQEKERRYKEIVLKLKKLLEHEKKNLRSVRTAYSREMGMRTELEHFLRQCVEDVKQEVARRRNEAGVRQNKGYAPGNEQDPHQINTEEFGPVDRQRVLELLLSQERVLTLLYDKAFPARSRAATPIWGSGTHMLQHEFEREEDADAAREMAEIERQMREEDVGGDEFTAPPGAGEFDYDSEEQDNEE
eukprot:GILI01016027.1.p1 GENE.GILI01016027.1~~GILI01016027.1.p1  ORF type:complete len:701 (-),score=172.93 GILI01016027.1:45-2147(-)